MDNIKLIRKMFAYEYINKTNFDMKDFKQFIKMDDKYSYQNDFKEWIDDNCLIKELKTWLEKQQLEKTFSEVYVVGKTSVEEFVDFLHDYGKDLPQNAGSKIVSNFLDKERKKNKDIFD